MTSSSCESIQELKFVREIRGNDSKIGETFKFSRKNIIKTIAVILSDLIKDCQERSSSGTLSLKKTMFHAKKIPGISILDYLNRIGEYSQCSDECFIYALIYLDRIGEKLLNFTLDQLNIHRYSNILIIFLNKLRFLLMSIITAAKFYDDRYYENKFYAEIGGLTLQEFVLLEKDYLFNYIDFNLYTKTETFDLYYQDLLKYNKEKLAFTHSNSN